MNATGKQGQSSKGLIWGISINVMVTMALSLGLQDLCHPLSIGGLGGEPGEEGECGDEGSRGPRMLVLRGAPSVLPLQMLKPGRGGLGNLTSLPAQDFQICQPLSWHLQCMGSWN